MVTPPVANLGTSPRARRPFASPRGRHDWSHRYRNYQEYLAWRTERGFTATFEDVLTQPLVINFYDESYSGTGIAARAA
jgi:hypothetical protein